MKLNSSEKLCDAVQLLIKLGMPENDIKNELLQNWEEQLHNEIELLNEQVESDKIYSDILEFVDNGGCNFLTNLSLSVSLYEQLFPEVNFLRILKNSIYNNICTYTCLFNIHSIIIQYLLLKKYLL